nr:uncharacterized protein LOC108059074 [Drosophila takahashii]
MCDNCQRLETKVDALKECVTKLSTKLDKIEAKNRQYSEAIMKALSELKNVTNKLVRQDATANVLTFDFPINSDESLEKIESLICDDNKSYYTVSNRGPLASEVDALPIDPSHHVTREWISSI